MDEGIGRVKRSILLYWYRLKKIGKYSSNKWNGGDFVMKKISFIGTTLIILVLLYIIFIPFQTYLVIEPRSTEGDPVLFALPEDHTFSVRYTHSIHLSEVEEFYRQSTNEI